MVVNTDSTREQRCVAQQATAVSPFLPGGSLGGALQSYSAHQTQVYQQRCSKGGCPLAPSKLADEAEAETHTSAQSECRQQQQLLIDTLADVKTRAARAFGSQVPHDPDVPLKETYAGGGLYGLNCNYEVGFHGVVGKQRKSEDYVLHLALGPGLFAPFNDCTRACLACVLDGHGGTEAVAYVAERFPSYLLEDLPRLRAQPATALVAALHRLDEELVAAGHNSGTTVNAVLLVDNALTIVNTGDCRAILYDWRDERAEQVTLDHNLSCAKERERVLGEGAELSTCGAYVVLPDPAGCTDGAKLLGVTKALGHASVKSFQRSASSISSLGLPGGLSGSFSGSLTGTASGLVHARSGATGASGALSSAASGGQGNGHAHGHGHAHAQSRVHWQLPAGHGGEGALGTHAENSRARIGEEEEEEEDDAEAAGLFGLRPGALAAAVRAGFGSGAAKGGSSSNSSGSSNDGREGQAVNGSNGMEMAFGRSVSALPALRTTVPPPAPTNMAAGMSRGASGGGPTPAAGEGYAPAASAGSSEVPTPLCSNGSSPAAPAAPSSPLAGATVFEVAGVAGAACGADAGGNTGDGGPGLAGAASQGPQFMLTCTPDVFERTIEDDRHLLLIGCDGVFDRMANTEACRTALRTLTSSNSCQDAAREVTHRACKLGSGDNITALLLRFGRKPVVRRQSCSVLSLMRRSSSNTSNAELNGNGAHAGANGSGGGAGAVGASPSPSPSPMGGGTLCGALRL